MAVVLASTLVWGLLSVLFGILILVYPKLLSYLIALYLIISGLMMMLPSLGVVF